MLEAQRRGHRVLYLEPPDLRRRRDARSRRACAPGHTAARAWAATPSSARRSRSRSTTIADVVFQRKDPPVDADYVTATQILVAVPARAGAEPARRASSPPTRSSTRCTSPDLMPPTRVTRSIAELRAFLDELGGEMIVKPLDGRGGEGIFHVSARRPEPGLDPRAVDALRHACGDGAAVPARGARGRQAHPARRRRADRRAAARARATHEHAREPARRRRAGEDLARRARPRASSSGSAPWLRRDGLFFVGIDVIGGLPHRGERDEPDGRPGDQRARGSQPRGRRDRRRRASGRGPAYRRSARAGATRRPVSALESATSVGKWLKGR